MYSTSKRLSIFTWHIHGSYLYYLAQGPYDIYIPYREQRDEGYYGRGATFPFGDNVHEIPFDEVKDRHFDCILFQSEKNYLKDQYEVLSDYQRSLPAIYLEHNTPANHPVAQSHVVNDPNIVLVHVTHFNQLMWQTNQTPTTVILHGVTPSPFTFNGRWEKGLVTINHIMQRGRALGGDIFERVQQSVPLDLAGMGNGEQAKEILHPDLPAVRCNYRFYFHPVRYTSLALAVCEAMMQGMPVVGLATTELVTVLRDGENGYIHTDVDYLIMRMQELLADRSLAIEIGKKARETALELFDINRFTTEWEQLFRLVANNEWKPNNFNYHTQLLTN